MKKLIWLVAAIAVLSGCASGARMSAMTAPVTEKTLISSESELHQAIEVGQVSGGKETNPLWVSKVSDEQFREALENSLALHTMLMEGAAGRYRLVTELVELKQPFMGFDMTVTAKVKYQLTDTKTDTVVFNQMIETPYTATVGDAFAGVKRLRLANEGAIRSNIETFIQQLIEQIKAGSSADPDDAAT